MGEQIGKPEVYKESEISINPDYPTPSLLANCIEHGAFYLKEEESSDNSDPTSYIVGVDNVVLEDILEAYQNVYPQYKTRKTSEVSDEGFLWEKETANASRRVLRFFLKSRLLTPSLTHDLVKFVGPSNTNFLAERKGGNFNYGEYFHSLRKSNGELPEIVPPPFSVKERNKHISVNFGKPIILEKAGLLKGAAEKFGIEMTDDDFLRLGMIQIVAHEDGHALDLALLSRGIDTFERAQKDLPGIEERFFAGAEFDIHQEHFARGVETIALRIALVIQGLRPDQIDLVLFESNKESINIATAYEDALSLAKQKGYEIGQLKEGISFLREALIRRFGNDEGKRRVPRVPEAISYLASPYSLPEIRYLIAEY